MRPPGWPDPDVDVHIHFMRGVDEHFNRIDSFPGEFAYGLNVIPVTRRRKKVLILARHVPHLRRIAGPIRAERFE